MNIPFVVELENSLREHGEYVRRDPLRFAKGYRLSFYIKSRRRMYYIEACEEDGFVAMLKLSNRGGFDIIQRVFSLDDINNYLRRN